MVNSDRLIVSHAPSAPNGSTESPQSFSSHAAFAILPLVRLGGKPRPVQQMKSGAGTEWFRTTTCIACHRLTPEQCINLNSLRLRIVTEGEISESLSSDHSVYAACQLLATAG